jgi:hypothetical protein
MQQSLVLMTAHGTVLCSDGVDNLYHVPIFALSERDMPLVLDLYAVTRSGRHERMLTGANVPLSLGHVPGLDCEMLLSADRRTATLRRDGHFYSAEPATRALARDRTAAHAWETFLFLTNEDFATLRHIFANRWIVSTTHQIIEPGSIQLREPFGLVLGEVQLDLRYNLPFIPHDLAPGQPPSQAFSFNDFVDGRKAGHIHLFNPLVCLTALGGQDAFERSLRSLRSILERGAYQGHIHVIAAEDPQRFLEELPSVSPDRMSFQRIAPIGDSLSQTAKLIILDHVPAYNHQPLLLIDADTVCAGPIEPLLVSIAQSDRIIGPIEDPVLIQPQASAEADLLPFCLGAKTIGIPNLLRHAEQLDLARAIVTNQADLFSHEHLPVTRPDASPARALVYLHGSDQSRLCVNLRTGLIGYLGMDGYDDSSTVELIGIEPPAGTDTMLLCANDELPVQLTGFVNGNLGIVAVRRSLQEDGSVVLATPDNRHYVTAVPMVSMVHALPVYAHATQAAAWETFTAQPAVTNVRPFPKAVLEAATRLSGAPVATIIDALRQPRSSADRAYAVAVIPLLNADDMTEIGRALLHDPACLRAIQDACPGDTWAWVTLPELVLWDTARRAPEGAAPIRAKLMIDRSFDYLEKAGYFGEMTTLGHACTVYARACILPSRGTCILASARNEGVYFLEWIAYHKSIGVEHFFIYTNDNEDGSDLLLSALADNGVITWIRNELAPGNSAQLKAFGHALSVLPDILDFKWVLITDLDEFFVYDPSLHSSIGDFLSWQDRQPVDTVAINWIFLGSTGQTRWSEVPLSKRNTKLLTRQEVGDGWRLLKAISKPNRIIHSEPHFSRTDDRRELVRRHANGEFHAYDQPPDGFPATPAFSNSVDTERATIYHYIFKSAEEVLWRNTRNRGDQAMRLNVTDIRHVSDADCEWFQLQDQADGLEFDTKMQLCREKQDAVVHDLRALPGVERAYQAMLNTFRARLEDVRKSYRLRLQQGEVTEEMRQLLNLAGV